MNTACCFNRHWTYPVNVGMLLTPVFTQGSLVPHDLWPGVSEVPLHQSDLRSTVNRRQVFQEISLWIFTFPREFIQLFLSASFHSTPNICQTLMSGYWAPSFPSEEMSVTLWLSVTFHQLHFKKYLSDRLSCSQRDEPVSGFSEALLRATRRTKAGTAPRSSKLRLLLTPWTFTSAKSDTISEKLS